MYHYSNSSINIGAWNIDGLFSRVANVRTSKLEFPPVQHILNKFDIFCLTETHCDVSDIVDFNGYHIVQNFRPKSFNAPHAFGGLAVGIRLDLLKGVQFIKPTHSEFMWLKLCKNFFGFHRDVFICNVYVSPANSTYSSRREDIFTLIEKDIHKFSTSGHCILMGDFNARTCTDPDFIVNDTCKYLNVHSNYIVDTPLCRKSLDTKGTDKHGKLLLDLCKQSGLRIVNGRKLGDLYGNYTCFNHRGSPSVIDYMLCDNDIFNDIEYFMVHNLVPFSIHCAISCTLQTGWCMYDNMFSDDNTMQLHEMPNQYIWSSKSADLWKWAVNQNDIKAELDSFSAQPNNSVDTRLNNFYAILKKNWHKSWSQKKLFQ